MEKIAEYVGKELKWVQPHASKMEYEMRSGDMVIATLRFRSSFGSFATAASADGTWSFKRVGFLNTRVTIRANGSETDMAIFKNNTWSGGGTLELLTGKKYTVNTNFWETRFEFKTEMGDTLIKYEKIGGFLHLSSKTEVNSIAKNIPEMPWMVMLGWYLTVMMYMDNAAAATIVASV